MMARVICVSSILSYQCGFTYCSDEFRAVAHGEVWF